MQLLKQTIILPPIFGVTEEAEQERNELASRAGQFKSVLTSADQNSLVEAVRSMRSYVSSVEKVGLELRRPLQGAAKTIKSLEDDHLAPLYVEIARGEALITDFQQIEARRVAAEEAVRREEAEKLYQERAKAEQEARKSALAMSNEADLAKAIAAEAEAKRIAEVQQVKFSAPAPVAAKAGGTSTRQVMRWNVLDIRKVFAARPELCKLEISPSAVRSTCVPEIPVDGLHLWWENETVIRKW